MSKNPIHIFNWGYFRFITLLLVAFRVWCWEHRVVVVLQKLPVQGHFGESSKPHI